LQRKKIITKFVPVFTLSAIGIFSSKIYLRLQGLNKEAEEELYTSLVANPDICWVAKSVGRWDLLLGMYTKDIIDFSRKKNQLISDFGKYIKEYDITQIEDALIFNRDYLTNKPTNYREQFVFGGEVREEKLSKEDIRLIQLIRNDARFEATTIAKKLHVDARTVINKVKDLQRRNILQGFTVFLDLNKIDIRLHKLCIYLQHYEKSKVADLIAFLKLYPNTIHLIRSLGSWELEIEIESDDTNKIYDYINELKNKFPDTIKQIDLVTITNELKLEFFPEKYEG